MGDESKISAPSPILSKTARRVLRYLKLTVVVLLLCALSVTKGFAALLALPLLLVVVPAVLWTQIATDLRLAKGSAHPSMSRWADIQLASAVVCYFVMPMAGDGSPVIIYIVERPGTRILFPLLTAASAIAFLIASVKFYTVSRIMPKPSSPRSLPIKRGRL
jgi:hypothetical protein